MVFQIADDLLDYQADEAELGKTVGDDFREGKMTVPVIFALQMATADEKSFWKRCFEDQNQTDADLEMAKTIIKTHKADEKSFELAKSYVEQAVISLAPIPQSPLKTILENLAHFALARKK
jgi:octaprenyl-diphosphate synthase